MEISLFDIVGPDMIGPSSSHTAGACKIAYMAKKIFNEPIKRVVFNLYGSFASTYKGHGTDKALVAGILGIKHNDIRIKDAMKLANDKIEYEFRTDNVGESHPNTVEIIMFDKNDEMKKVVGISIGGGNAIITKIDNVNVNIDGRYNTLIILNKDIPGVVAKITNIIAKNDINIGFMKLYREDKGMNAITVMDLDEDIPKETLTQLEKIDGIYKSIYITAIK